jgi:membrane-bound lytic murein transglycosylase B
MTKIVLVFVSLLGPFFLSAQFDADRVDRFVSEYASLHNISQQEVRDIIGRATYQPTIIEKISKPYEGTLTWEKYRNIFVKPDRIEAGVAFWNEHQEVLKKVSQDTGVPEEIIIGIIGVETKFGRIKGDYQVLDALATLAFGYPKRAGFFKSELEEYITLARRENLDLYGTKGSYAGAMGYCQFMPSSYRAYAVSFEEGGTRDLMNSPEDAIASVANYLKVHRWQRGEPIVIDAYRGDMANDLNMKSVKPKNSLNYYLGEGYAPESPLDGEELVSLMDFDMEDGSLIYKFGLQNFYVITRYNHSKLYALAVVELGRAVKAAM